MRIFKIYDEEFEQIVGQKQLKEFAVEQVQNASDDYLAENLDMTNPNMERIVKKAEEILTDKYCLITIEQAKQIIAVRNFEIEEIEVF